MKKYLYRAFIAVLLLLLPSCAEKGPMLIDGIKYQAPEGVAAGASKVVVGIAPLKDDRGKTVSVIGRRTAGSDIENDLVVQGTTADMVTAWLRDALKARGITVRDVSSWDLQPETIRADGMNILIGGEIKTLWAEVVSQPLNVKTVAEVKLRISAADATEKRIFRTLVLNSKQERQDLTFSSDFVSTAISEALSSVFDQLLKDDEFKKRIH